MKDLTKIQEKEKNISNICTKEIAIFTYNSKQSLNFIQLYDNLKQALKRKGVFLSSSQFSVSGKSLNIDLSLFYNTSAILLLKRSLGKKINCNQSIKTKITRTLALIPDLFLNRNLLTHTVYTIKNLNAQINKDIVLRLYKNTKLALASILKKKRYLLIDIIKISSLIIENKVSISVLATLLGHVFKTLPKKIHNRFFLVVKLLFRSILAESILTTSLIKGIKLKIGGRLRGKPRADSRTLIVGSIPLQTIDLDIQYSKEHVYTLYGAFGLKIFIYRK